MLMLPWVFHHTWDIRTILDNLTSFCVLFCKRTEKVNKFAVDEKSRSDWSITLEYPQDRRAVW